ncbi:MAG: acyltransferase family protein, partial [Colwellia sp.]
MDNHGYRADIDGLRAVAVLLVVIYHSGFSFIPGGYIGVDVFFVISGFLITGILSKEILSGSFTYSAFYKRRIRRLMPALFAVILVTSIVSVFILLPNDLLAYGRSVISVLLSLSNVYFWRENGGYFDGNVQEVPLLHTWSLSVEEQFYLLWPLMLMLVGKFLNTRRFILFLVAITVVGVFFSQWVSEITFGAAYYLLPTRAFELLIGSILALSWSRLPVAPKIINHALSLIGISLILVSAVYLNEGSIFPGYNAIYPTIGAALLIYSGGSYGAIMNRALAVQPIVWIGVISYSLYLWHWPVAVFIRYTGVQVTETISLIIIFTSLVLAWVSYKYIELPFRKTSLSSFKKTFKLLFLAPSAIAISMALVLIYTSGFPGRYEPLLVDMEIAVTTKPANIRAGCHSPSRNSDVTPNENCQLGEIKFAKSRALLIGDSHGNHFSGFMDEIGKDAQLSVMDYTLDECLPIFDLYWGHNFHYSDICRSRNSITANYILKNKFDFVILAGHWPTANGFKYAFNENRQYINKDGFKTLLVNKLSKTISAIELSGSTAVIIKDTAPSGHKSPKCV